MGLVANIEPVQILNKTGVRLSGIVTAYDLAGKNCRMSWWLLDSSGNKVYESVYSVSSTILSTWGTDDKVLLEALAESQGITIISYM